MNVFDIIGPIMVGPSSSHTAGAVRIGRVARMVIGETPSEAIITLYGSFAKTYQGHGTDKAIVAGLMDFDVADERIIRSLEIADEKGIKITFIKSEEESIHPNTVKIDLKSKDGKHALVTGCSIGGGSIEIVNVNGVEVNFTGEYYTIIITHQDAPGAIARVSEVLASKRINIAFMKVFRKLRGQEAIMVIEADQPIDDETAILIENLNMVNTASIIKPMR